MILLFTSLIAGVLTVLAPCTIALLPVIVGGTLAGGRSMRRAFTVTIALGVSVLAFTLLLKAGTTLVAVPQIAWEIFSGVLIAAIGLTMLFPEIWDRFAFARNLYNVSNRAVAQGYTRQNFWGDVLVGASLGPVFSSCSPTYFLIIATVLPQSLAAGFSDLLAYALGLCAMLLIVAVAGQRLLEYFNVASDPKSLLRRGIGVLFLLIGVAIAFGWEQQFELAFANSNIIDLSGIEKTLLTAVTPGAPGFGSAAPEITNPSGFINTDPITLAGLKEKVVLVDFWDYTCINCQREVPYVEAWWQKYQNEGLVVVGVHTPEFSFEHLQSNVAAAVKSLGITYPVVLDNQYGTWNAFGNEYWPQIYLINADGKIVYSHSGEGEYPQTEAAIQQALADRAKKLGLTAQISSGTVSPNAVEVNENELGSPETYFGSDRNEYLANGTLGVPGPQRLTISGEPQLNGLYLSGLWNFYPEYATTQDPSARIIYDFDAKNVYMVARGNPPAKVRVLLDGKPLGAAAGADVSKDGTVNITEDRLYTLLNLPDYGEHTLEIDLVSGTLNAYTFTFG